MNWFAAFNRQCPQCGAEPSKHCIGKRGDRKSHHRARYRGVSKVARNDNRVADYVEGIAEAEKVRFLEYLDMLLNKCESPIEQLLVAALYNAGKIDDLTIDFMPGGDKIPAEPYFDEAVFVYQQICIGEYRADFVIHDASLPFELGKPRVMIVECDGHDFHERTKEQARRDKKRDRYFQSRGYKVLRFTGSEIWADPDACADEILDQLAREDYRRTGRE